MPTGAGATACTRRSRSRKQVKITADKENLARLSFQRFFRQYPILAGMTGTAWESRGELWQIYRRAGRAHPHQQALHPHPPARAHVRHHGPEVDRRRRAHPGTAREGHPDPVRHAQRAGQRRGLAAADRARPAAPRAQRHADQGRRPRSSPRPASSGQITVATNMAGRGTDIKLARAWPTSAGCT